MPDADRRALLRALLHRLQALLRGLRDAPNHRLRTFFAPDAPLRAARAPGRLDVMGGIADYSGATVLELPLACGTYAVVQPQTVPRIDIASLTEQGARFFGMDLASLRTGRLADTTALRGFFAQRLDDHWAAYVVGGLHALLHRVNIELPDQGLRLLILSDVPEGKGVSSSAALEVAAMTALAAFFGLELDPIDLAKTCQWIENRVVGAPCGVMDQVTVTCGRADHLLRLDCQTVTVEDHLPIPDGYAFFGIDSGLRHAVTGADYGTVRTAAFMGYRIIADLAGLPVQAGLDRLRIDDPTWHGFLANIDPDTFAERFREHLPEQLTGAAFIHAYHGTTDPETHVDATRTYPVRAATAHPIHEQARILRFAKLLDGLPTTPEAVVEMGALMVASHASYSACGLGSPGTDRLVELAQAAGPAQGVFGAKITGGGSGGTVAVFARREAEAAVRAMAEQYREETGRGGLVLSGSSPGAAAAGTVRLEPPR